MSTIDSTKWASISFTLIVIFESAKMYSFATRESSGFTKKTCKLKKNDLGDYPAAVLESRASLQTTNRVIDANPNLLSRLASSSEWPKDQ